ncbi:MAG: hypothetical protein KAU27_15355, partial [Desulfuromonadales bacterium]|nr:hypothetical protein [Desulfuromonadales bacterium]
GEFLPGEAKLPIGVSENWFVDSDNDGVADGCREEIHFDVTGTSCAGWHTYEEDSNTNQQSANIYGTILAYSKPDEHELETADELAARLAAELELDAAAVQWLLDNYRADLDNGDYEGLAWLLLKYKDSPSFLNYITNETQVGPYTSPGAVAGVDDFNFTGGVVGALLNEEDPMPALFDFFKVRDDDGNDATWTTTVPVYKDDPGSCINPNQSRIIVGAADIIVKHVNAPPASSLDIEITCGFEDVRGGGGTGGVVGTIPNLVE